MIRLQKELLSTQVIKEIKDLNEKLSAMDNNLIRMRGIVMNATIKSLMQYMYEYMKGE